MERPLTRRGSAVENQWQQNSEEVKSATKAPATGTEQPLANSRPFSRMVSCKGHSFLFLKRSFVTGYE